MTNQKTHDLEEILKLQIQMQDDEKAKLSEISTSLSAINDHSVDLSRNVLEHSKKVTEQSKSLEKHFDSNAELTKKMVQVGEKLKEELSEIQSFNKQGEALLNELADTPKILQEQKVKILEQQVKSYETYSKDVIALTNLVNEYKEAVSKTDYKVPLDEILQSIQDYKNDIIKLSEISTKDVNEIAKFVNEQLTKINDLHVEILSTRTKYETTLDKIQELIAKVEIVDVKCDTIINSTEDIIEEAK